MKYETLLVIHAYDLEDELNNRYEGIFRKHDIRQILFRDDYINDVYKRYSWEDGIDEWTTDLEKLVIEFLSETFPNYTEVLIDVSW